MNSGRWPVAGGQSFAASCVVSLAE
jgi:hypothetical protein